MSAAIQQSAPRDRLPPASWPDPGKRTPADVARVALMALALVDRTLDFASDPEWEDGQGRPLGRHLNRAVAYLRSVLDEKERE